MRDVVIIGGGHNGLVAAILLARAGFKPIVLERRDIVGGAAITSEIAPGFRCPTLAHIVPPWPASLVRELRLPQKALERVQPDVQAFAPAPDGSGIRLFADAARSAEDIGRVSPADARAYPEYAKALGAIARFAGALLRAEPPSIAAGATDYWTLLKAGRGFRRLGRDNAYRLLRYAPMAVADMVAEWFSSDLLRATCAARGIFGSFAGPWSAGTGAALLMHAAIDPHPSGSVAFLRGGPGALTQALAAEAAAAGARVRTGAEVTRVLTDEGRAIGVRLADGEEIRAAAVVSNADPRRTLLELADPLDLEPDFLAKMRHYRARGVTAKVNLALGALPRFTALARFDESEQARSLAGRIHIGPGIDYLERAFDAAKYGGISAEPYLDATIPSISDPSLAPAGKHVMSICAQYAPYALRDMDWGVARDALATAVMRTLDTYAPGIERLVLARQVITPLDLERDYGLTGGHIYHGDLALDQLFTMRPLLGWARYRTPIEGLYLCGNGTHPGLGVTGLSGAHAGRAVIRDLRRR